MEKSSNLDVGKLGVVNESFKIVMQPGTIQCHLRVPLIYCCHYVMDYRQVYNILINGAIYKQDRVFKINTWCK